MEVSDQSGELHALAVLALGKIPRHPLYRRLGGAQSRSGQYTELEVLERTNRLLSFHYILRVGLGTRRVENTAPNISSLVTCVFVAAGTCFTPAFRRHITLLPP
jgi:hypothetical protein